MRYLLNLPLFIGFIATARACFVAVLSGPLGGGDAGLGTAYEMLFETAMTWIMLAILMPAGGAMGGYRWPAARGFAGFMVGLMAFGALLLVSLAALGIALELGTGTEWGAGQVASARLVAFGLPFVVIFYVGWIVNAPLLSRNAPEVHGGVLGVAGLLCVVALVVAVREMARESGQAQVTAAANNREEEAKADAIRRDLAKLTDADSLFAWNAYLGGNVPPDVQAEAMRRVAARPRLETELAEVLRNVGNYPWSQEGLSLVVRLPFKPSPALAEPVRVAIGGIADRLTREAKDVTYDGDKRIDRYERYTIDDVLAVAERMAETAGVDLGDSIDAVVRAVALYPKSEAAREYPAKAVAARKHIARLLAAGHK